MTWAYLAWRDRDPWLIAFSLTSGVLGMLGPNALRLIDALGRAFASAVPRDGFGWGALALIAAFALLAAGARRSLGPSMSGQGRLWAVALLPTLALNAGAYEPRDLEPKGDFVHPTSGFVLPEAAGEFRRIAVTQYDEAATDISAGYLRAAEDGKVWPINATVYVYRVGKQGDIDEYFTSLLADLGRHHGGATPDFRQHATLSQGRFVGRYAALGYEEPFFGVKLPLRSYLVLYRWKDWWVKWRVTTPAPRDGEPIRAMVTLTETLVPPLDHRAVGPLSR